MKQLHLHILFITIAAIGCTTIEETSKHPLDTGVYRVSSQHNTHFYAVVEADSIDLYPLSKIRGTWTADSSIGRVIHLTSDKPPGQQIKFSHSSFDLDLTTILFKYRPHIRAFPNQLNTNFNSAEFIGYRTDYFILSYDKSPLNTYKQRINRFAFSFGGLIGLGATAMNPFVTANNMQLEYDGVIITKGVAGLMGVGDFTFGAGIGFDNLLDKNRKFWIYENKPWVGFTIGFNIN